jgi:hypothetical protein
MQAPSPHPRIVHKSLKKGQRAARRSRSSSHMYVADDGMRWTTTGAARAPVVATTSLPGQNLQGGVSRGASPFTSENADGRMGIGRANCAARRRLR